MFGSLAITLGVAALVILSACAKPPIKEIATAEAALEKARSAEAPTYAPETFKSAEQMLTQAKTEMQKKKYKPAKKSAINARLLADRALEEAAQNKAAQEAAAPKTPGLTEEEKSAGPVLPPQEISVADLQKQQTGTGSLDEGLKISALETVRFNFDDFSLSEEARQILAKNAEWLKKYNVVIQIEGHCDERGANEYNLALGEKRAKTARDYLVALGIDTTRLTIISYGEEIPVDPGHDDTAWAKNRRAEFIVKK
ncbi:MAG: peptidoglycan-associated lipoprotein Pal [Proteobacteria bacterium]|jgi:peptidoglycan-associated lipoprotein|nr:peptidoglycan-associated lipoprotein Pal [Pseudomonadota bacterium]